ncbi:hypothetical protein [Arthrobacter sp. ERGS1:01]|uniref:hypothetical protein n=1 Tax=Arthrobacter sp. ERGS1:01 TaxID=1704044 RepID=UPI000A41184B|nr:hypothetical protein [Arthrobacter sp. ERGS1:01]
MSNAESSTPARTTAATPPLPEPATPAKAKPGVKAAVGSAVAAATLAAVTVLSGPVFSSDPAAILAAPVNSASSRIAGVKEDMARAVALQQVTAEQAAFLENQLVRRIQSGA